MLTNQFHDRISSLFNDFVLLLNKQNIPILVGRLPLEIFEEIDHFTRVCNAIKNHPLYFLKNHTNVGRNKFQVSVPTTIFEDSFTFAYLIHLGEYFLRRFGDPNTKLCDRPVRVRKNNNHFDAYDFWLNFIEPGDYNNWHTHGGVLSGVIYVENSINFPTLFECGVEYNGSRGEIIMFPSSTLHSVARNTTNNTRLTYAYNLDVIN